MKRYILIILSLFLLFPSLLLAEEEVKEIFEIKGVIGDFAPDARVYEVSGEIYEFDEDITIESQSGDALTFADLRGGMSIKIIGEKSYGPDGEEKIKYVKIIVKKKKLKVK